MQYGTYIISGIPGSGKGYFLVNMLLPILRKGKRPIASNFPFKDFKSGKIVQELILEKIIDKKTGKIKLFDSIIVIDEGWKKFNARGWQNLTEGEHGLFAEARHNRLTIFVITQHEDHIEKVIRDNARGVYRCKSFMIPFTHIPFAFRIKYFSSLTSKKKDFGHWKCFKWSIASSYDHEYFGNHGIETLVLPPWPVDSVRPYVPLKFIVWQKFIQFNEWIKADLKRETLFFMFLFACLEICCFFDWKMTLIGSLIGVLLSFIPLLIDILKIFAKYGKLRASRKRGVLGHPGKGFRAVKWYKKVNLSKKVKSKEGFDD